MRILFATAEVSPIAKTGGLGDVCGALPKVLHQLGHEVVVFMPYYRQARDWFERNGVAPESLGPATELAWANWSSDVSFLRTMLPGSEVPLVLVANDHYFDREQIYSPLTNQFDDYLERFTFFCRAVIRGCDVLGFDPEVLHAHDWHAALLPVYLQSGLRGARRFASTRSVYTIHNLNYQGNADPAAFAVTGLHSRYWAPDALEHFGEVNPMKGGIIFADQVTTVSPTYAHEIQSGATGAGLDGLLRSLSFKLSGILNGIDVSEWDPATDPQLTANYDAGTLAEKASCKRALQKEAGLASRPKEPMFAVVSRLVEQKGFQHLIPILPSLLRTGAQAVILGSGDGRLEEAFRSVEKAFPDRCRVWTRFDSALAHRIYGGADVLLMPSVYEPCGLNQMYALRYGVVPVVHLTGGLADTVVPFDGSNLDVANGFGFAHPSPSDVQMASWLALLNYRDRPTWRSLQENGMAVDHSWERSARQYEEVYRRALAS